MFYPLSILDYTYIYVYKPGYDSRPPLMDNCWTEEDEKKRGMTETRVQGQIQRHEEILS